MPAHHLTRAGAFGDHRRSAVGNSAGGSRPASNSVSSDNIAAISRWHGMTLAESADLYFDHCRVTARLGELCEPGELLAITHEGCSTNRERD